MGEDVNTAPMKETTIKVNENYIVAHLFKARTVEPEKQPLLGSGSANTAVY
jgi:hypothetical protein